MIAQEKTLALYVHIPFCVKKCLYCDFLSGQASLDVMGAYIRKVSEELHFWKKRLGGEYTLRTVFIGGGTPTCLPAGLLLTLEEAVFSCFSTIKKNGRDLSFEAFEYTIEANPGTITKEILTALQKMQVNRISLGLQSANDTELKALGRIHTFEDFLQSYHLLREVGFQNINVDLMADIPGQTLESYQSTLQRVCELEPEHISSYSLIVEEGTPFSEMQEKGLLEIPDEELDRQMYEKTEQILSEKGYFRYEISNYAKKGKQCRHNLTYWELGEYLGIGLGASSLLKGYRFRNETDLKKYLAHPANDSIAVEKNRLSKREEIEEFVFLGLRKMEGISLAEFEKRFSMEFSHLYQGILEGLFEKELLAESRNHDRIYLTKRGIDVSNMVLSEFLLVQRLNHF